MKWNSHYCECGGVQNYCETHDAYYCNEEDRWLESACTDPDCEHCRSRPEKPSMVQKPKQTVDSRNGLN